MKFALYSILIILLTGSGCGKLRKNNPVVVKGDSLAAAKMLTDSNRAILILKPDTTSFRIWVYGRRWFNNNDGKSPVQFWLNQELMKSPDIVYSSDSTFLLKLPRLSGIRNCVLTAIQQNESSEKKTAEVHFTTKMQRSNE